MESLRAARRGKGSAKKALRIRAAFADLPPGEPEGAAPELEVQVVNRRAVATIAGKDDAPDEPAVAVSGGKLRTPRKQPGGETPPGSAQPPELVEDPLDHDRERTVDYLRLADLEMVDAAQPGTEERVPLRLVTNSGLALALGDDFACGIGLRGGLRDGHLEILRSNGCECWKNVSFGPAKRRCSIRQSPLCPSGSAAKDSDDRRRTWRACPFPWPPVRRAGRI